VVLVRGFGSRFWFGVLVRHEGTKALRNTKVRRGEKSKGGCAEMIFFVGRFRHEFVSSWFGVLVRGFGSGFWFGVLVRGFGSGFWFVVLVRGFGSRFWFVVLVRVVTNQLHSTKKSCPN
jgi:hypothetical protein